MTLTCDRAPLLCYLKFCTSFCSQWSIQTGVRVQKHLIRVKIRKFLSHLTLIFDRWPWKTIGHLFTTSSFMHHFIAICEFKLVLQSKNAQTGSKLAIFLLCDLEMSWMTLKNNRANLLCHIKPCTSFRHHMWIQTRVTVWKQLNWVLTSCDLDLWPLTLTFCMDITFVNSNHSWKFHDIMMRGALSKRCDGRTDRRTDRQTDRLNHS